MAHLTSSHLTITFLPWSRLPSCHLNLPHFTLCHVMTSDPTLLRSHLEICPGIHQRAYQKKHVLYFFNKANFVNRRTYERTHLSTKGCTKQIGPCTIIHLLISIGQLAFAKLWKRHIRISAGCIHRHLGIIGIRNPPSRSFKKHGATK